MVWEFSLRFDSREWGITQEFRLLNVHQYLASWPSKGNKQADNLPKFPKLTGEDGWEKGGHTVNQDLQADGVTWR